MMELNDRGPEYQRARGYQKCDAQHQVESIHDRHCILRRRIRAQDVHDDEIGKVEQSDE